MPTLDSQAAISIGGKVDFFTAPDASVTMSPTSYGSSTKLVNGSTATVASQYASNKYSLAWKILPRDEFLRMRDLVVFAGEKPVYYIDMATGGLGNILSPLAAKPYLLDETMSPACYTNYGTRMTTVTSASTGCGWSLNYTTTAADDGKVHSYTEKVLVPAGYRCTVQTFGTNTQAVVKFNGSAVTAGTPVSVTTATTRTYDLVITKPNAVTNLTGVTAVLTPSTAAAPTPAWAPPEGLGELRVVPGSWASTVLSARNGLYAVNFEIEEVWPWR